MSHRTSLAGFDGEVNGDGGGREAVVSDVAGRMGDAAGGLMTMRSVNHPAERLARTVPVVGGHRSARI